MLEDSSEEVAFHWARQGWGVAQENGGWQKVPGKESVWWGGGRGHACCSRGRSHSEASRSSKMRGYFKAVWLSKGLPSPSLRGDPSTVYSAEAKWDIRETTRGHRAWDCQTQDAGPKLRPLSTAALKKISIKLNIHVLFDSATTFPRIYPRELKIYIHRKTYPQMCVAGFSSSAKNWKQPKRPSTGE